jgi:hypothetical protein
MAMANNFLPGGYAAHPTCDDGRRRMNASHPTDTTLPARPVPDASQPAPEEYDALCETCGYSLIALAGDRCPECGAPFDPSALPLARVPWLYRKRLGAIPSFIVTACRILTRPHAFATELNRPVRISLEDARQFRKVCIIIATIALTLTGFVAVLAAWKFQNVRSLQLTVSAFAVVGGAALLWLMFALMTDLPTFLWEGTAEDKQALSPPHYYASAPLLIVPIAAVLFAIAAWFQIQHGPRGRFQPLVLIGFGILASVLVLQWVIVQRLAAASGVSTKRRILLALYLPVHWLLIGILCLFGAALIVSTVGELLGQN